MLLPPSVVQVDGGRHPAHLSSVRSHDGCGDIIFCIEMIKMRESSRVVCTAINLLIGNFYTQNVSKDKTQPQAQ